tara:strand:+ start:550 stop:1332 length:783 start_codon:yes stop_codon:yes gene_type:complete
MNHHNQESNLKTILKSHFDEDGEKLSNSEELKIYGSGDNNEYLRAPYQYVEEELINNISNQKILDYCCGTGVYSIIPALNNAKIFGIDISNRSIDVAKERADIFNVSDKCIFNVCDAEKLSFEDNFFDLILSYGSLSYLDLEKSFKELRRVLKPNGKLIVIDSLGYNPIINFNRKTNIKNYARDYLNDLKTITHKDLNISLKYFNSYSIKYFDFFTLAGYAISKKFQYRIDPNKLTRIDNLFLRLPLINRLSFKFVCIIS